MAIAARAFLVAMLIAASSASLAQRVFWFAGGAIEVVLPESFDVVERADGSLLATFGEAGDHRLELSLSDLPSASANTSLGEQFVRDQAERRGRKLSEISGKVVFMDPAGESQVGGKKFRAVHWQVGFGRSVVVITLTAPAEISPALNQFLGKPLNNVVNSLRRRAA